MDEDSNILETIRMSNILARKYIMFNIFQQKLFYITLAHLNYGLSKDEEIKIQKNKIMKFLNLSSKNNYMRIKKELKNMILNSFVSFGDDEIFTQGVLFTNIRSDRNYYYIKINIVYKDLLYDFTEKYIKLLTGDVLKFNSRYSMMLYQNLLCLKNKSNNITFTTKQLKDMFGLDKNTYMRKNETFDRNNFERKTIDVAIKEINEKSKWIFNLKYEKQYDGKKVKFYKFTFQYLEDTKLLKDDKNYIENFL